jgi:ABC-type branched-subunit amino acid transport system substrate-binding protein
MKTNRRNFLAGVSAATALSTSRVAFGQKKYDTGATDTEIKIGHTNPYSGPASSYSSIGKLHQAYFRMVNETGGINGRRISFISYDDGYQPPKTVEMIRKLVEEDQVLACFNMTGTPCNSAIHKYLNQKKVPQLFVATGASKWGNPKDFPWTMGYQPDYHTEGVIYAKHILANVKDARIGVLYQNDDYGKDYFNGIKDGLGREAGRLVKVVTYETTDPTVDNQIIELKNSGANVFYNVSLSKFAAQAMRKAADLGWKPLQYMNNVAASVGTTMKPAGFDNVQGVLTAAWLKDPTDHQWDNEPDMKEWRAFMAKYIPDGNLADGSYVYAYGAAALLRKTLEKCGDLLTRENLMKQAASWHQLRLPGLLPGITVSTGPTDFYPVQAVQLSRFKGDTWELFGDVMHNESS